MALTTEGKLFVWGDNNQGQLGMGHQDRVPSPILHPWSIKGTTIKSVHCGPFYSVVLTQDGRIFGWGAPPAIFPEECVSRYPREILVPSSSPVLHITCGYSFMMMITESGEVFGLGQNGSGQLGMGLKKPKISSPTLHKKLTRLGVQALVCGGGHSLAVVRDGSLLAWGFNNKGPLGTGNTTLHHKPVTILQPTESEIFGGISEICAGNVHSMALMRDGTILIWGEHNVGQVMLLPTLLQLQPRKGALKVGSREGRTTKEGEPKVVYIGTGINNSLAMREDGMLFIWGVSYSGQLVVSGANGQAPIAIPSLKFRVPPKRTEERWRQIFSWLFLGFQDPKSIFSKLNVEVIFTLVMVFYSG
jgi:alpha-tubulin suppressor-like RCC1 family protein